jgi:hypothetical protein
MTGSSGMTAVRISLSGTLAGFLVAKDWLSPEQTTLRTEYPWTPRLGVGIDARYVHLFLEQDDMDVARVTARVTWRF